MTLPGPHADHVGDLRVREVGELGEHERRALVVGQARDVGHHRAQVGPRLHLLGEAGGRSRISSSTSASARRAASSVLQRLRAMVNSHGRGSSGAPCSSSARWARRKVCCSASSASSRRADHVAAEAEQRPVMAVVEDLEGALVAAGGELGESGVREQAGSTHEPITL